MTFEERLDAIAVNLELTSQVAHENEIKLGKLAERISEITAAQKVDSENIRALARIAEIHEHRLTSLEGGERA
jgi:hypothetical protein